MSGPLNPFPPPTAAMGDSLFVNISLTTLKYLKEAVVLGGSWRREEVGRALPKNGCRSTSVFGSLFYPGHMSRTLSWTSRHCLRETSNQQQDW